MKPPTGGGRKPIVHYKLPASATSTSSSTGGEKARIFDFIASFVGCIGQQFPRGGHDHRFKERRARPFMGSNRLRHDERRLGVT
jgi:hypothetical protein